MCKPTELTIPNATYPTSGARNNITMHIISHTCWACFISRETRSNSSANMGTGGQANGVAKHHALLLTLGGGGERWWWGARAGGVEELFSSRWCCSPADLLPTGRRRPPTCSERGPQLPLRRRHRLTLAAAAGGRACGRDAAAARVVGDGRILLVVRGSDGAILTPTPTPGRLGPGSSAAVSGGWRAEARSASRHPVARTAAWRRRRGGGCCRAPGGAPTPRHPAEALGGGDDLQPSHKQQPQVSASSEELWWGHQHALLTDPLCSAS